MTLNIKLHFFKKNFFQFLLAPLPLHFVIGFLYLRANVLIKFFIFLSISLLSLRNRCKIKSSFYTKSTSSSWSSCTTIILFYICLSTMRKYWDLSRANSEIHNTHHYKHTNCLWLCFLSKVGQNSNEVSMCHD